jgi:bifunctional UDP-N-acetylglucosamine pyrophosphorylase / glucosamine-1-phosphate N-acetyltransferase
LKVFRTRVAAAPAIREHVTPFAGTSVATTTTTRNRSLAAVILAAGKGKRLRSARPKVLHPVCGRSALWHVVQTALAAKPDRIVIVVGREAGDIRDEVSSWGLTPRPVFVEQAKQLGTAHAVLTVKTAVGRVDDVLVANGDFDPVFPEDLRAIVRRHRRVGATVTIASTELRNPGTYQRIVREGGRVIDVVEGTDASAGVRRINEVGTNWMVFRRGPLFAVLPKIRRDNRQREYYLNDAVTILLRQGERVDAIVCDTGGTLGLNSRNGLAAVTAVVRARINDAHMAAGVTLLDPSATYIDVEARIGPDTTVYPNTFIEGATTIGAGCSIGPSARIVDATIGDRSEVTFSVIADSTVGRDAHVGPFARLRDGVVLADGATIGNFVEAKATRLGRGSKAKHLTYLGDAEIGDDVNVGAGTVTVNYDGYRKHQTRIEDGASIGSDTMLVAPIEIGRGATTGAGSVITKDVPPGALAVERGEQRTVPGYRERKDAEHRRQGSKRTRRR